MGSEICWISRIGAFDFVRVFFQDYSSTQHIAYGCTRGNNIFDFKPVETVAVRAWFKAHVWLEALPVLSYMTTNRQQGRGVQFRDNGF